MNEAVYLRKRLFTRKDILTSLSLSITYLLLSALLIGFKTDQLWLILLFNILYFTSTLTRKFVTGFSIFIVYWIMYDYMKAIPNYLYNEVSIEDLYQIEKTLFGITSGGLLMTPNEYLELNASAFLDVLSGLFYLMWIPVPLAFATWLFFRNRKQFLYFALTFVLVNLIGFVLYYIYPAAPPWYVQNYGFDFIAGTPGNPAGLARFDRYFDIPVFETIYTKASNVFAAMPSLHASYPVIVLYYGLKNNFGYCNILLGMVMLGIWFAAIYSSHHYLLDVLAGILCAIIGMLWFSWLKETRVVRPFIDTMLRLIN